MSVALMVALALVMIATGPLRALHEAPLHDPDCGLNKWAWEKLAYSDRAFCRWLWLWLDTRVSSNNKYKWAEGRPAWVGKLLKGPLVAFTDLWHFSQLLSNILYTSVLLTALLYPGVPLLWAVAIACIDDVAFEPSYQLLRNYK